jgi:hypothetical protein
MAFNHDDVLAVAQAMVESYSSHCDNDYCWNEYTCDHCGEYVDGKTKLKGVQLCNGASAEHIVHKLDCPVLIAQDLLTGSLL